MRDRRPTERGPAPGPVWLPWLVAPLFMAAPIGGCALAGRLRAPPAVADSRGPETAAESGGDDVARLPNLPTGAVVTVGRP